MWNSYFSYGAAAAENIIWNVMTRRYQKSPLARALWWIFDSTVHAANRNHNINLINGLWVIDQIAKLELRCTNDYHHILCFIIYLLFYISCYHTQWLISEWVNAIYRSVCKTPLQLSPLLWLFVMNKHELENMQLSIEHRTQHTRNRPWTEVERSEITSKKKWNILLRAYFWCTIYEKQ